MKRSSSQNGHLMTVRVSGLFVLFLTVLLAVGGGLFPHFGTPGKPIFGAITIVAEELRCPAYNLRKVSYPASELTDWKTFRSEEHGFEFMYPPNGGVQTYDNTENKKVRVDLPVAEETLLREKFLLVNVEKVSEKNTYAPPGEESGKLVFINGRKFSKKEFEEGAAGHLYEHTIYSTVAGDSRFVLDFVLHSVNPGVFESPPPGFDWRERIVFSKIASTFKLTRDN